MIEVTLKDNITIRKYKHSLNANKARKYKILLNGNVLTSNLTYKDMIHMLEVIRKMRTQGKFYGIEFNDYGYADTDGVEKVVK